MLTDLTKDILDHGTDLLGKLNVLADHILSKTDSIILEVNSGLSLDVREVVNILYIFFFKKGNIHNLHSMSLFLDH